MVKESFEYVDITLLKELEQRLEEREEKVGKMVFRVCPRCKVRKQIYQFTTDRRNTNGRTSICKKCKIIEYLKYYYANRENVLLTNKRYRDDHKGQRTIYFKDYQKDHKEHLQKIAAIWYKKNKVAIKKRNLKYYNANKEVCDKRRRIWIENNEENIKEYNRQYKRKQCMKKKGVKR